MYLFILFKKNIFQLITGIDDHERSQCYQEFTKLARQWCHVQHFLHSADHIASEVFVYFERVSIFVFQQWFLDVDCSSFPRHASFDLWNAHFFIFLKM